MDVLTDKSYKEYDSLSRFTGFPTYYNKEDEKYVYGLLSQLDTTTQYVGHKVLENDTLEAIAFKYYGRPDFYWVIAMFNNINDCFCKLSDNYTVLKVPTISNIVFK